MVGRVASMLCDSFWKSITKVSASSPGFHFFSLLMIKFLSSQKSSNIDTHSWKSLHTYLFVWQLQGSRNAFYIRWSSVTPKEVPHNYTLTLTHRHWAELRMDTGFCGIWDQAIVLSLLEAETWFAVIQGTNFSSSKGKLLVVNFYKTIRLHFLP